MRTEVLVDTGPLVAYFDRDSEHHDWVCLQASQLEPGWLTSEAVLGEAGHLLRRAGIGADELMELVQKRLLVVPFQLGQEASALRRLLHRYRNVPMSLADATLVRLSELYENCRVFTLDSDFVIYRRFDRRPIPLLMPASD